jgi:hypothetical protein
MALRNLFDMVKADRYTQDGREELIKAQEECTEDVKYNNGDISQKTGLMKTPNGWVEPPKGRVAGKRAVEAKGKEVQRQMKHDDLVSRMAEEERIWNKNHPDKAHYNYNPKPTEKKTESKPATEKVASTQEFIKIPTARGYAKVPKEAYSKYANNKTDVRLSDYIGRKMAGKPSSESNKFYDFVQKKIYESGEDPKPYLGQGGYSYPQRLIDMYYDEWKSKTTDSAPRVLTGDTRIRVRKA